MNLVPIIFGWPAVVASVLVTIVAVVRASSKLAVAGALFALPFMLYMFLTPRFRLVAPPIFALHLAAAYALQCGSRAFALLLFLPFAGFAAFVARLVLARWAG